MLDRLSEEELLELASSKTVFDRELNKAWFNKNGLNFPYKLTTRQEILNGLTMQVMRDGECDKLIVEQADRVRRMVFKFH